MKVLIVLTSHDQLGDTGKKTGFWLEELAAPYYALKDAGAVVEDFGHQDNLMLGGAVASSIGAVEAERLLDAGLWAPEIQFFGGKYYLYYAASETKAGGSAIGVATGPTPTAEMRQPESFSRAST